MPETAWGFEIAPAEFESWILFEDSELLAVNKPGGVVCHPSKRGPRSSLIGAAREFRGLDPLHMPSRLDRETSGVVVFAKNKAAGSRLQKQIELRQVSKRYLAILQGRLERRMEIREPIGLCPDAAVKIRRAVRPDGKSAVTAFEPLETSANYTFVAALPQTGRMHQIRVHAAWAGHPIAGDKIYGPDETLYLEFVEHGFTPRLAQALPLRRHALHAERISFAGGPEFLAPLARDLIDFWRAQPALQGEAP
ncbi:MAG: RNA pseudouridine synthase [Bryobacteraceae bacterium]|nr:RNA pseudouridine synthase [Bryobacteraceae bacterium]